MACTCFSPHACDSANNSPGSQLKYKGLSDLHTRYSLQENTLTHTHTGEEAEVREATALVRAGRRGTRTESRTQTGNKASLSGQGYDRK